MLTADFASFKTELRRLQGGRNRHFYFIFAAYWAAVLFFWLTVSILADAWIGRFWNGIRYIGAAGLVVIFAVALLYYGKRLRRKYSAESAAAMLGRAFPKSGDCLVNAVQLEQQGLSQDYLSAVLSESPLMHRQISISELYPASYRRRGLGLLLAGTLIFGCLAAGAPKMTGRGLRRLVFPWQEVCGYTQTEIVEVTPGNTAVKRGDKMIFGCRVRGRIPAEAAVEFFGYGNQKQKLVFQGEGIFQSAVPCTVESGRYRIHAGDDISSWYDIRLISPPVLAEWRTTVIPPEITRQKTYELSSRSRERGIPAGSRLHFKGRATENLRQVSCLQENVPLMQASVDHSPEFSLDFTLQKQGGITLEMQGESKGTASLPFIVIPDRKPRIVLKNTALRNQLRLGKALPVTFRVEDDYGILRVGLERVMPKGRPEQVSAVRPPAAEPCRVFEGRFLVETGSFDCRPGDVLKVRCWAEDDTDISRRAYTPVIELQFTVEKQKEEKEKVAGKLKKSLEDLVRQQRAARSFTDRGLNRVLTGGGRIQSAEIQKLQEQQKQIREQAEKLLQNRKSLGMLADQLAGLVNHEMLQILRMLEESFRQQEDLRTPVWQKILVLQTRIIAVLTGVSDGLDQENMLQEKQDFFALIQKIIQDQRKNLKETKRIQGGEDVVISALVHNQERLAESLQFFQDRCRGEAARRNGDEFVRQLLKAVGILEKEKTYEQMLCTADELENRKWGSAVQFEEKILKGLMKVMNLLNQWRMKQARKILEKAGATLAKTAESLSELEKKQARIAEVTRDFKNRGGMTDQVREKLAEMDREQEQMADEVEKLANDLYQFPELPVCSELNSKMREIFEDVQQAEGSENAPAIEIAVQKEDTLLDSIRNAKKRIEDVEMWLPDVPDNIVWNMESFDTDEFPDIPLVPLPDELEDIVGELLEQESSIDAQSQDTTGNNIVADDEMGWGIMDGPMPSFAAKGKSGNTRPNDNEMTGRSGSGREGQASGELVENHVKGYEGRKTHARRTMDQFQKGMVTEDENSTADARATGGGKLGGESETQGMFGAAPRRDLHTGSHGRNPRKLRQETEVLYATARLLYLGTGSLGAAAIDMRSLEQAPPAMKELGGIRRRVMRQLSDSQVELRDGVVLPMPVEGSATGGGISEKETSFDHVSGEYRELLKDYYRSLD